jgi:phospholipid/cholesterol/gamma-HCH transport system substrate-binding protein
MHGLRAAGWRRSAVAMALAAAVTLSSCSSINVDNLPQPGTSYRDGYDIVLEFDNVLNLPDRANVVMDGTPIGVVTGVDIRKNGVDVSARVSASAKIPSDVHAELQQATVLGDTYVALERNRDGRSQARPLEPNGRIPLAQTTSPPQLEGTLVNLANFVGSGSIQRIQSTIININRVTPERKEQVQAIAQRVSTDLADLSNNIDTLGQWFNGLADTVNLMAYNIPMFQFWFSETGMRSFDIGTKTGVYLATILPSIGTIFAGGYWLVPFIDSFGIAVGAVQKSKWAIEGEYRPWRELFTDTFLPADKYPAMNIISVQTPDGREITQNVEDVLRMLGAIP